MTWGLPTRIKTLIPEPQTPNPADPPKTALPMYLHARFAALKMAAEGLNQCGCKSPRPRAAGRTISACASAPENLRVRVPKEILGA